MNLKGDYSGLTSYSVGDVVRWTDSTMYVLREPCISGTPPTDTLFWERMPQSLQDACDLIIDYGEKIDPGLPTPAIGDAGKVLGVDESGEWALASGGGGGGSVLVVHDVEGTLDATWKQIVDAVHGNGVILEKVNDSGYYNILHVAEYGHDTTDGDVYLLTFHCNNGGSVVAYYSAETENGYPVNDD